MPTCHWFNLINLVTQSTIGLLATMCSTMLLVDSMHLREKMFDQNLIPTKLSNIFNKNILPHKIAIYFGVGG